MSVHMYACMYACASSIYYYVTVLQLDMSLNKYSHHTANMTHTAITLNGHMDQHFCIHVPIHKKLYHLFHMLLPCICRKFFF